MAKRNFQKVQTYTWDNDRNGNVIAGSENTERSSFATLESAIAEAQRWIRKEEAWMDTTVKHIEIINKETKEVVWKYEA